MNFFEYQDQARKWTHWLVALYALAVALTVLAVYGAAMFAFHAAGPSVHGWTAHGRHLPFRAAASFSVERSASPGGWWDPTWFLWSAGLTLLVLLGGTVYKVLELAGGGAIVARLMGGTPVAANTADPDEQRLRNVVEEMAIASGTPVPQLFVLHEEPGINAFAAGHTPQDAAIAVTRGALQHFNRDELQGVIGHEFSHILNGDMRMNIRLMGVLHGLLVIALAGYACVRLMGRAAPRRGKGGGGGAALLLLFGLLLMVIGYVGVFFANLIKAAIGREREYLADAASAQFTRNPLGLAGALKKIAALSAGSTIAAPEAAQTSHFFIAEPGVSSWLNFMATHPPLEARIRRLDPAYSGDLADVRHALKSVTAACVQPPAAPACVQPLSADTRASVGNLAARVGAPDFQSVTYAAGLLAAIPEPCRRAAADPGGAQTVLFSLALASQPEVRQRQMARLATAAPGNVYTRIPFIAGACAALPPAARLPLADLAVSALRALTPPEYHAFRENLAGLVAADNELDLFEFMLLHLVSRRMDRHFGLAPPPRVRYRSLGDVQDSAAAALSVLAWNGADDADAAAAAYERAWQELDADRAPTPLGARADCALKDLDRHLGRLADAAPQLKAQLLTACGACVAADGRTSLREAETLRAIADALDCPIPPFAPDADMPS